MFRSLSPSKVGNNDERARFLHVSFFCKFFIAIRDSTDLLSIDSMNKGRVIFAIFATATLVLASCNVNYDMVTFVSAGTMPAVKTPVPTIAIDTNVSAGMAGGDVKSSKPYDIQAYYIDDTFTFASAEFTTVSVTYADGSTDAGSTALKLPVKSNSRVYESHNSMAGGVVVANKSRIIQAELTEVISRDEDFTLLIEGKFTKDDGVSIPFKIEEKYKVSRDKRTESWWNFVSGC